MILKRLPTGMFSSNCYIVGDKGEGIVIDPGVCSSELFEAVDKVSLKIKYILITHAHIDHICSVDEIRKAMGATVAIHEADASLMGNSILNGSKMFTTAATFKDADLKLKDGDILEAGGLKFEIIHTPGHSPGGICIKVGNNIFTGDTLFKMSVGRTDLGNGEHGTLINSIKEKLMTLDDETVVYPGHGTSSTIGYERRNNPFL